MGQINSGDLIEIIFDCFALPLNRIKGLWHWAHVSKNRRRLPETTGINPKVIGLLPVFHKFAEEMVAGGLSWARPLSSS